MIAKSYLGKEEPSGEPVLHSVDRLITYGIVDTEFRRRLRDANKLRNKLIHSISIPLNEKDVSYLANELCELLSCIRKVHRDSC
jgi:uncharacterized protein YutE (UPF0331/DUF86 family)